MSTPHTKAVQLRRALDHIDFGPLQQETGASAALLEDFKRFLALKAAHKDFYAALLSPSPRVDELWHAFILDTLVYQEACEAMLGDGGFIHHNPRGGRDAAARWDDASAIRNAAAAAPPAAAGVARPTAPTAPHRLRARDLHGRAHRGAVLRPPTH